MLVSLVLPPAFLNVGVGGQRLGGSLVFLTVNGRHSISGEPKPSAMRAGLLTILAACLSLSACSVAGTPIAPGTPTPSVPSPAAPTVSAPSSGEPSTPGPSDSTPLSPEPVDDPNDVPPDDTDYSKDVGNTPQQYEYEPELEPPESVVATLCNLNQIFFKGLRSTESGEPVADSNLRTSMVALDDLMDYWKTLRAQHPDSAADIDTAIAVHEQWKSALLSRDNGDQSGAKKAMTAAEELIKNLPEEDAVGCIQ